MSSLPPLGTASEFKYPVSLRDGAPELAALGQTSSLPLTYALNLT